MVHLASFCVDGLVTVRCVRLALALLAWQLKAETSDHQSVIAAKAVIQAYQGFSWIPALRFAAAGMTK
jgi:hypothetical protein